MTKGIIWSGSRTKVQVIVDIVIWFAVAVPVLILFLHGTPYDRGFFCNDASLSFPFRPDTVSTSLLLVAGGIVSVLVIVVTEVLNCIDTKCRQKCLTTEAILNCVKIYAVFLVGFILEELMVKVVKDRMGTLRPNFFDVCKPHFNISLCPSYITNYTCTSSDYKEIRNSRLSFPSGHASLSMYTAIFFCMYIEDRLQISFSRILKLFLQAALIFIAIVCGVDRIIDNKHHPSDVIAGYLFGLVVAICVYHKVGRKLNEQSQISRKSHDCYTCAQTEVEPQTPMPLLQNDQLGGFSCESRTTVKSQIF